MEIEGITAASSDTVKGLAVHKKVDHPSSISLEEDEIEPDKPQALRSLTLTSKKLSLTATLDLAEIKGQTAIPIEYRKGKPQAIDNEIQPWETDLVQIALQALLLEDSGYCAPEGIIYYAQTKQKLPIKLTPQIKNHALEILEAAKQCATKARPLPLINDPKCPKCSLYSICLPDEINSQRNTASPVHNVQACKVLPVRDDGIHLVSQKDGYKIGVRGMELQISDPSKGIVKTVPLVNLQSLSLLGNIQISTQAIHTLAESKIPIAFLSSAGRLISMIDPLDSVSAETRKAQVRELDKESVCTEFAKALIISKITNQRTLLLRNHQDPSSKDKVGLKETVNAVTKASSLDEIRGYEGQAASIYFRNFAEMIKSDTLSKEFARNGRQRRPPPDPINSCLSLAYSMLTHECVAALRTARLEPSIGGFHVSRPGRPALALDLMEPFRPLVSDSVVLSSFNRGELTDGHFQRTAAGCFLTEAGRRAFFDILGRRMDAEVTHPVFGYKLSYRRMIILHAKMIAAWLLGEIPDLAFLTTR